MKATVIFFPNKTKKSARNGMIPLYVRICFKGEKSEARLNAEISDNQLLDWDAYRMRINDINSAINHYLNRLQLKFEDLKYQNASNLSEYSAAIIKDYILGTSRKQKMTISDFVDNYFNEKVLNNVDLAEGTIKTYRRAINHLNNFLKYRNEQKLLLEEFNYEHAAAFKSYLTSSNRYLDRVGMSEVSAAGVIKKFRTICNHALQSEVITKNPFKQVKIKTKSPKKERMTIDQVRQLFHLDLSAYPGQVIYRDIYLYGIFTGLAYHDLINHNWNNLHQKNDGNIKLSISRVKTDVLTESFLVSFAKEIAIRYKNGVKQFCHEVFPYRSNKEMNSQLKFIAHLAKIPIRLTTHIARHTFRQLLAEAGITDYGVIKRMMGQSRNNDVDSIYYDITEPRLMDAKCKFEKYLTDHLVNN